MSRVLKSSKAWVSIVTCHKCGSERKFHHGIMSKKDAILDWPSESWNGWSLSKSKKDKEECPTCRFSKMVKQSSEIVEAQQTWLKRSTDKKKG